ncbi:MAG: GAF domain-containing sensor histidine kinase [Cyanobacteria bacterium J06638_28]
MPQLSVNLLDIESPIFEEATQTASRFLGTPICIVGIPNGNALVLKAAVGLSQLGLMNPLARTRRLPLDDELSSYVWQEKRRLILPQLDDQSTFANSFLAQEYGIQSYLGVPLLTTDGSCVGVLAAMDVKPTAFAAESVAFLELLARWSISEYERHDLAQRLANPGFATVSASPPVNSNAPSMLDSLRLTLMSQLTQDMRNPLTTITGMANMLSREIYGALTPKQREYAEIVSNNSQALLKIANEVLDLSNLGTVLQPLNLTSVDFEMLGQQLERTLLPLAEENNQEIRLTVEPDSRLWKLDKELVRHLLQHLVYSVIKLSGEGGTIRVHGSERDNCLHITVWVSHPWLGEGLPNQVLECGQLLNNPEDEQNILSFLMTQTSRKDASSQSQASEVQEDMLPNVHLKSREALSLLLSRHLIECHGGTLTLQGNTDSNSRFLIVLPSA